MNDNSPAAFLEATALEKRVASPEGELTILRDINLKVAEAETLAIVGASGSGKSTLLSLLAGLDAPTSGTVMFCGHRLSDLDEDGRASLRAGRVGFVFQSFQLLASLTALENVMLPLELAGNKRPRARAMEILGRVELGARVQHYPRQLSGGEQQRVALARAFACEPSLLFADEPTGNLDQKTGALIGELLFELNRERDATLILVTHDLGLAKPCDRVVELENGRMV